MIIRTSNVLQAIRTFRTQEFPCVQDRVLSYSNLDKIVGETEITTHELDYNHLSTIKAYIAKKDGKPDAYFFLDKFGEKLGYIELDVCKMLENNDETYYPSYSKQSKKQNKFPGAIHIQMMKSFYSGTGNALHEFAVALSNELGYKGRVILEAAYSSHIFHYLFGFRSASQQDNKDIEEAIKFAERRESKKDYDTTYLGMIHMYLPENTIPKILNQTQIDFDNEMIQEFPERNTKVQIKRSPRFATN